MWCGGSARSTQRQTGLFAQKSDLRVRLLLSLLLPLLRLLAPAWLRWRAEWLAGVCHQPLHALKFTIGRHAAHEEGVTRGGHCEDQKGDADRLASEALAAISPCWPRPVASAIILFIRSHCASSRSGPWRQKHFG